MKRKPKYKDYVCPICWNKLPHCACKTYPQTLLQIDDEIQECIKAFNTKGYYTKYCCGGHYNNKGATEIYIRFERMPEGTPEDFVREKKNVFRKTFKFNSKEDFIAKQQDALNKLYYYATNL